ncbi:flippase activity-associated protein Agl23 [Haloarcula amylovorans]|uniref:flippase activity-associated protein Agl23 n=1 Tax=Haloarcula amylovorans TaxID=2562280 RepID=UPI0010768B9C|nr:flippase activity-associated protein Agl23 [Halomicroarcula amylolytica]
MASSSGVLSPLQDVRRKVGAWTRDDDHATLKLVAGITLLALVLRLAFLGQRVAHFDEGRVAYWAWHYSESGSFAYRYIIHGPFIQHVDRWMFALIGTSDFAMRLPVAVVGGLLPLSALLFRRHLRRSETVAMALLLAINPLLLYYSRFMRSDVLVAAFMFVAFGLFVRFYDTRLPRYLYAASVFVAFGFASKENALVYVVTWLGASGLLLAKVIFLPNGYRDAILFSTETPSSGEIRARVVGGAKARIAAGRGAIRSFRTRHDSAARVVGAYAGHLVLAVLLFGFVSLFFYAPRGAGVPGIEHPPAPITEGTVGFWEGITNPALFGDLLQVTVDRVADQWGEWLEPASEKTQDGYVSHFKVYLQALGFGSAALALLAGVGYVLDRLGYTAPRHLVPFLFYAGFVSIFGYPLGTDIGAPWLAVHTAVPFALPAAVGLAAIFRWGLNALSSDDVEGVGITAIAFFLVILFVTNAAVTQVYTNSTTDGNPLVQYAQPEQPLREELTEMHRISQAHDSGPDVVVYHGESGDDYDGGNAYVKQNREDWNESWWNTQPTCIKWYNMLPMPWYFASSDAQVACENGATALGTRLQQNQPPIVITQEFDSTAPRDRLQAAGYENETYSMRTSGYKNVFTVWTHEEYVRNETAS